MSLDFKRFCSILSTACSAFKRLPSNSAKTPFSNYNFRPLKCNFGNNLSKPPSIKSCFSIEELKPVIRIVHISSHNIYLSLSRLTISLITAAFLRGRDGTKFPIGGCCNDKGGAGCVGVVGCVGAPGCACFACKCVDAVD